MKSPNCPNRDRPSLGKSDVGSVIRHGFYQTRRGRRRRYLCQACGKTFCSSSGTAYYRLQHLRATFDKVASLSVEGLNKSAIARVKRVAWNTVHRWLERNLLIEDNFVVAEERRRPEATRGDQGQGDQGQT
jgi:transposase-like protein